MGFLIEEAQGTSNRRWGRRAIRPQSGGSSGRGEKNKNRTMEVLLLLLFLVVVVVVVPFSIENGKNKLMVLCKQQGCTQ